MFAKLKSLLQNTGPPDIRAATVDGERTMKAIWNGTILAESEKALELEGNFYFPPDSVNREYLQASDTRTVCPWKGQAAYYDIVVDDETGRDAAWYYPAPSEAASNIKDRVAFWKDVKIVE